MLRNTPGKSHYSSRHYQLRNRIRRNWQRHRDISDLHSFKRLNSMILEETLSIRNKSWDRLLSALDKGLKYFGS